MRPVDIKTINYRANRASKRRQPRNWKFIGISFGVPALIIGLGLLVFATPWFRITSISYQGLSEQHRAQIQALVDQALGQHTLKLPTGKNIFFLSSAKLQANIAQLDFLNHVSVSKDYTHTLTIAGTERTPEGVWCFQANSADQDCKYFDHGGVVWGNAIQSSGFLLLNVNDERVASGSPATVDPQFLKGIQTVTPVLNDLGTKTKEIIIPAGSFTEFDINTAEGYPLRFSLDSDLNGQVNVFRIFRQQKLASGEFHPQYLDLRFDGRVYYK
jgi:hypothetical protein